MDARLAGRHGRDRRETLAMLAEDGFFDEADMRQLDAAFSEGVDARRSGYPCHCINCHTLTPEMLEKDERRSAYHLRRHDELAATGKTYDQIARIIDAEIAAGAAQQQGAVVGSHVESEARMSANLAHVAALQVIKNIAEGTATALTLPRIASIASSALGPEPAAVDPRALLPEQNGSQPWYDALCNHGKCPGPFHHAAMGRARRAAAT